MADVARSPESERYSAVAIFLHWTIAALIVLQVVLSTRMLGKTPEAFAVFQLHKSVGITVLLLSLARLAWRLIHRPPPEPATLAPWERRLAALVHWAFYFVMIAMPLTGWIMVSTSRIVLPTLLYGVVPWPHISGLADLAAPAKKVWYDAAMASHQTIIKGAYVLFALHVAGALKHQWFGQNEPVLSRMAPGARGGRWLEPRLLAAAAGLVAVVAFGFVVQPRLPAMSAAAAQPAAAPALVEAAAPIAPTPVATVATPKPAPASPADVAPPAQPAAAPSAPTAWKIDSGSSLNFASAWSGQAIEGRFDRWTADILFSPDALDRSKVTVSIDMGSVNTGDQQRDASLPSEDWFNTAAHPKATFTATKFTKSGEGRFTAHGQLSLRGVSKPLDLPFRLKITGDRAEVSGVTSLDRTTFGVGQGEWASTDQIPAKVTVRIALKAHRT